MNRLSYKMSFGMLLGIRKIYPHGLNKKIAIFRLLNMTDTGKITEEQKGQNMTNNQDEDTRLNRLVYY